MAEGEGVSGFVQYSTGDVMFEDAELGHSEIAEMYGIGDAIAPTALPEDYGVFSAGKFGGTVQFSGSGAFGDITPETRAIVEQFFK